MTDDDFAMEGLKSLRRAVAEALERKRLSSAVRETFRVYLPAITFQPAVGVALKY